MVDFYDPIQKKELSYYIDKRLLKKWNNLRDGKLIKEDSDRVYIVDGRERGGKSTYCFQQAKYLDPTFNLDRVCFTPDEFLNQIRNAPKGSVIVFDEAFRGLSSKASQSKINKKIVEAMMEVGQRNLIIFIILPTIFLLEIYPAVLRSNALFHIYKDKSGKRAFRIYNEKKKAMLYYTGKKKGFSYDYPKVKVKGRFFNIATIEDTSYRAKKLKSLVENEKKPQEVIDEKYKEQRDKLIYILSQESKKGSIKLAKVMEDYGIDLKRSMIQAILSGFKGKKTITNGQ